MQPILTVFALPDMLSTELAAQLHKLPGVLHDPLQALALVSAAVAALLVLVSAFVKTIIPLRWLALSSNVGFVVYGLVQPNWLMLALHAALLPVNLWRVLEMQRLTRRVRQAGAAGNGAWLQPHMRRKRFKAGSVLFRKGDMADRLYVLAEGRLELRESGIAIEPGRMFGEIAFFAPDRRRSATAVCATPCTVLSIDQTTFEQLFFQNPAFGLQVVRLIAGRLTEDVQRLEAQLVQRSRQQPPAA